jgi:hypothetical protein
MAEEEGKRELAMTEGGEVVVKGKATGWVPHRAASLARIGADAWRRPLCGDSDGRKEIALTAGPHESLNFLDLISSWNLKNAKRGLNKLQKL